MRYVSWVGDWLGHLMPQRRAPAGTPRRELIGRHRTNELSNEDLFYIAMLGPHV